MLTATLNGNEIVTAGEVQPDDVYPGYCCPGHAWEVAYAPAYSPSVWGVCQNPDCPVSADDGYYRGVKSALPEDLAEWLVSQ